MFTFFQTTISLVLRTEIHLTITFLRHHNNRRIHCYAPGESLTTFWHPVTAAEHYSIWLKDTYLLTHRLMDTIPTVALQLRLSSACYPLPAPAMIMPPPWRLESFPLLTFSLFFHDQHHLYLFTFFLRGSVSTSEDENCRKSKLDIAISAQCSGRDVMTNRTLSGRSHSIGAICERISMTLLALFGFTRSNSLNFWIQ